MISKASTLLFLTILAMMMMRVPEMLLNVKVLVFCDFAAEISNKTGGSEEEDRKPDRSRVLGEGQDQPSDI